MTSKRDALVYVYARPRFGNDLLSSRKGFRHQVGKPGSKQLFAPRAIVKDSQTYLVPVGTILDLVLVFASYVQQRRFSSPMSWDVMC